MIVYSEFSISHLKSLTKKQLKKLLVETRRDLKLSISSYEARRIALRVHNIKKILANRGEYEQ